MHLTFGLRTTLCALLCLVLNTTNDTWAQRPVSIGGGSVASFPPTYKAKTTTDNSGFNATAMLSRKIYADELASTNDGQFDVPGRPLPTNDWWTDIINSQFSGALWSYPAMLSTSEAGVTINWPSYWADQGKEMKSLSKATVGAVGFRAQATIAKDWHDWDVVFRMPGVKGGEMTVTSVHGAPFTWFEYTGEDIIPEVTFSAPAQIFNSTLEYVGVKVGSDLYGFYFPKGYSADLTGTKLGFGAGMPWLVGTLLRSEADLASFARFATSIPRDTRVSWNYDESLGRVNTEWSVTAENLRDKSSSAPVLQGFLPHAYKYALAGASLNFIDADGFMTPRGKMKLASSTDGSFRYSYQFSGQLPMFGAPAEGDGFRPEVLERLMTDYAEKGTFGGDTYWGGKGLLQMAMNMNFAKEAGNEALYEKSKTSLRDAFENWLTYTPGENTFFFSYYPRWGAMLGFDVSYDSDAFNDHHFHYGYFTYAAALLCLEDKDFAEKYSEILTMIAKDYANWDREDGRFPFMRTLDPWCGHSWAGGLGDAGNDNGNGQESTSEAMQSWGGIYLLGVALGNKDMRDAGIWGWNTEARATREYWFDVDAPRPANAGGRKLWAGKNDRQGNYDYNEYPYAYNSNITGKGIGWWTWFGGDPLYMHGIQWMPASPALDYLSWDPDFVAWAFDDMMTGANSTFSHTWFEPTANSDNGERIDPLATNDWGNVAITYFQRANPLEAARIFDEAYEKELHIASSISTSHISYYLIHSHLTYGDPDFSIHADIPTAQVYVKNGEYTYFVYNPEEEDRTVNFFDSTGRLVKTVIAPARKLAGIKADPIATSIEYQIVGGTIVPPGETTSVTVRVLDQYGAGMLAERVTYALSSGAKATIEGTALRIAQDATKGSTFTLTLSCGDISETINIIVNDRPIGTSAIITGVPQYTEMSLGLTPLFTVTDQYMTSLTPEDTRWQISDAEGMTTNVTLPIMFSKAGKFTLKASSATYSAEAEAEVLVVPELPLVSLTADVLASSAENVGTLPADVNDGDLGTRWGSAHTDDEWIILDLGEDHFISKASLVWEAAFASHYELQVAPDGCTMTSYSAEYAGQTYLLTIPADTEWTTAADVTIAAPGERTTTLNTTGRYVRMHGLARATGYGYSLFEMGVHGLSLSSAANTIIGIDLGLPEVLDRGEAFEIHPKAYTLSGETLTNLTPTWTADKEATFEGNVFTPLASGIYTVTAHLPEPYSSTVFVNDVERPESISFAKETFTAIENEEITIEYTVMNQFMAPYSGSMSTIPVTLLNSYGDPTDEATYDTESHTFHSSTAGDYTLRFGTLGECTINVRPLAEVNLAIGKIATASSNYGNSTASLAVDGDAGTRWESAWEDNQTFEVDLESVYLIDRIKILWEGAHATEYSLAVSIDGATWFEFYTENDCKGGTENITFEAVPAQFVRINCIKRATGYGFSFFEFEVFGQAKIEEETSPAPTINGFEYTILNGGVSATATASHPSGSVFMTLEALDSIGTIVASQAAAVSSDQEWSTSLTGIPSGVYTLRLTAADAFGNSEVETINDVEITFTIVGMNLALNKNAYASSAENGGLGATNAVDGKLETRWGSDFNDNEWIVVDLGQIYSLTDIHIYWNNAAYATHYTVLLSSDDDMYTLAHRREGYTHPGTPTAATIALDGENFARYVKVVGEKRANGYGTSIDELEVYGNDLTPSGIETLLTDSEEMWFTLQGLRLSKRPTEAGFYIHVNSEGSTKVRIE